MSIVDRLVSIFRGNEPDFILDNDFLKEAVESLNCAANEVTADLIKQKINDPIRLKTLRESGLLDLMPDEVFDRLTRIACLSLDTPMSFLSLVDSDRLFYLSRYAQIEPYRSVRSIPVLESICQFQVALAKPLVVKDASKEDLIKNVEAVTTHGIESYLGIPLKLIDTGTVIGSFCVCDLKPREWTEHETTILNEIAKLIMILIEMRRVLNQPVVS